MQELDFNTENSVKVVKAMERGLVAEYERDVVRTKITGEQPEALLEGMAKTAMLFVAILNNETDFRNAVNFLSRNGVAIE